MIAIVLAWLILPAIMNRTPRVSTDAPNTPPLTNRGAVVAARAPSDYKGRELDIKGRVVNDPEYDAGGTHFQFFVKGAGGEADLVLDYPANIEITAGDFLQIKGVVRSVFVGSAEDGTHIETLRVEVEKMTPLRAAQVLAPATSVWRDPGRGVTKNEITVAVDRIEFARGETRAYLNINNGGNSGAVVEIFNSVIEQKGQLFSPLGNPPPEYKKLPVDVGPGKKAKGVLVFPPVNVEERLILRVRMSVWTREASFDFQVNR